MTRLSERLSDAQIQQRDQLFSLLGKYSVMLFPGDEGLNVPGLTQRARQLAQMECEDLIHQLLPLTTSAERVSNRGELSMGEVLSYTRSGPVDFSSYTEAERTELRTQAQAIEYGYASYSQRAESERIASISDALTGLRNEALREEREAVVQLLRRHQLGDEDLYASLLAGLHRLP